jgi:hypothetical protein
MLARRWSPFPHDSVHKNLQKALSAVLTPQHELVTQLRGLWRQRKEADYELAGTIPRESAEDNLDKAEDLIAIVDGLSDSTMKQIAGELFDIDRTGR